jgi:outer membrane biosynthesis protein TonB
MKLPAKCVAGLLPFLLAGCVHKNNQAQVQQPALAPPIVDSPPPPTPKPTDLPPPVLTPPKPTTTTTTATQTPPPPPPKPKHKKKAAKPDEQQPQQQPANTTEQASNGAQPAESAIGQLSTGDPADVRTQTADSIAEIEKTLKEISSKLNAQQQKTAAQIEEFLKEATKALTSGDADGAQTLAAKAKVLLGELTQ